MLPTIRTAEALHDSLGQRLPVGVSDRARYEHVHVHVHVHNTDTHTHTRATLPPVSTRRAAVGPAAVRSGLIGIGPRLEPVSLGAGLAGIKLR
jgi:hypothetical protein